MRVLVTGGSGVFGRVIARDLARQGADVVAFARRTVDIPGVTSFSGDIRDPRAVEEAMQGCDRVVHLAFLLAPLRSSTDVDDINLGGTRNVLRAMENTGANHLVFASSTLAYGPWPDNPDVVSEDQPLRPHPDVLYARHKALCEEMISESGVPAVITRTCVVAGRDMDNYEFRFLAHPMLSAPTGPMKPWQFLHTDDVGRFHAQATLGDKTGVVNVGPTDLGITIDEIAQILGKPLVRLPFKVLKGVAGAAWRFDALELSPADLDGFRYMPTLDTRRLVDEWGYTPMYDSRSALADAVDGVKSVTYLGTSQIPTPWRTPSPDHGWARTHIPPTEHRIDPAPPGLRGEFDDLIDDRYPVLTSANVGEAFAGALTPMSLHVGRDAMRVASALQVDLLGMRDPAVVEAQRTLGIASVGHRLYTNVSVVHAMAAAMPGTSPAEVDEHILGIPHDPEEHDVSPNAGSSLRQVLTLPGAAARMAGSGRRIERLSAKVLQSRPTPEALAQMSDGHLQSRIDFYRELVIDAWAYSTTTNLVASAAQTALRRMAPGLDLSSMRSGIEGLPSTELLAGVRDLAAIVKSDRRLEDLVRSAPSSQIYTSMADVAPQFDRAFRRLLDQSGHRGPGETELANLMYADAPERLIEVIKASLDAPLRSPAPPPDLPWRTRRAVGALGAAVRRRERGKDTVTRATHSLRSALREVGRRHVERGNFADVSDVFYLTPDEVASPALHADRIDDRRAERERLAAMDLPSLFTRNWQPLERNTDAVDELTGLGVSPGLVRGTVKILRDPDDEIASGAVLVAHVTDVGWTTLFDTAAAVVTEVGGLHSHAAIVAREMGVPCVVAVEGATLALTDGETVEVNGTTGVVRRLL